LNLPEQVCPEKYEPLTGESLHDYRDRLYQVFRMPLVLAALNDLKAAYVEVANPFLTARVIRMVRHLPLSVRWDKKLLKGIVEKHGPRLPFATRSATLGALEIAKLPRFREYMLGELQSDCARGHLSKALLDLATVPLLNGACAEATTKQRPAGHLRRLARRIRGALVGPQALGPPAMPFGVLALRATLVSRMCRLLSEDALFATGMAERYAARLPVAGKRDCSQMT